MELPIFKRRIRIWKRFFLEFKERQRQREIEIELSVVEKRVPLEGK